jgi:hypothetical protein
MSDPSVAEGSDRVAHTGKVVQLPVRVAREKLPTKDERWGSEVRGEKYKGSQMYTLYCKEARLAGHRSVRPLE